MFWVFEIQNNENQGQTKPGQPQTKGGKDQDMPKIPIIEKTIVNPNRSMRMATKRFEKLGVSGKVNVSSIKDGVGRGNIRMPDAKYITMLQKMILLVAGIKGGKWGYKGAAAIVGKPPKQDNSLCKLCILKKAGFYHLRHVL